MCPFSRGYVAEKERPCRPDGWTTLQRFRLHGLTHFGVPKGCSKFWLPEFRLKFKKSQIKLLPTSAQAPSIIIYSPA